MSNNKYTSKDIKIDPVKLQSSLRPQEKQDQSNDNLTFCAANQIVPPCIL